MGGSSYDRDVYSSSSSSGWGSRYDSFGASDVSREKMSSHSLDASMFYNKTIKSYTKNPIIVVLDVTGSNIDFARVVYDKLPMFYGQIEEKGYLEDFDICFCAVGDAYHDDYPLQIANFAKGIELDTWIEKIVLEGGGGAFGCESYDLMAYYLSKKFEFENGAAPIIFFIGDEVPYLSIEPNLLKKLKMDFDESDLLDQKNVFYSLRKKVNDNVFMLLNKACGREFLDKITNEWNSLLAPQHVVKIMEEKSIIDLMLGIISMMSSSRTLETYKVDMLERGQTKERIENVSKSLDRLSKAIVPVKITGTITTTEGTKKSSQKGKRL